MKKNNIYLYLISLILLVFSFSCGPENAKEQINGNQFGSVEGIVFNAITHDFLSGVEIKIGEKNTTTGYDGKYHIDGINTGPQPVMAKKPGYQEFKSNFDVMNGPPVYFEINLMPINTFLNPPKGVEAKPGNREISIGWQDEHGQGATSYNVYMNYGPEVSKNKFIDKRNTSENFYTWRDLLNYKTYFFVVTSINPEGQESMESYMVQASPTDQGRIPPAPQGVFATGENTSVQIKWDPVFDATKYKIYMNTSPGVSPNYFLEFREVMNPGFKWEGLINDKIYYFVITAINSFGESPFSNQVEVKPSAIGIVPSTPKDIWLVLGNGEITIFFIQVPDAMNYDIYMDTSPGITKMKYSDKRSVPGIASNKELFYTWAGFENNKTYYFAVCAKNSYGESDMSPEINGIPLSVGSVPNAPTGVNSAGLNSQISLSWNSVLEAVSYNIYMDTTRGVSKSKSIERRNVTSTNYIWPGLLNNTSYYFVITAQNNYGESKESGEVVAIPSSVGSAPGIPMGVTPIPMDSKVNLSWGSVPGATEYNIYMSTSPGVLKTLSMDKRKVTSTSFLWTGLYNNSKYYFVVTAQNSFGESAESIEISATPGIKVNNPPVLATNIAPKAGTTLDDISFYVDYSDIDGDIPVARYIYVNGTPHTMEFSKGTFSNGTYYYKTKLEVGVYNYYFEFSDSNGNRVRFPNTGAFDGPVITSIDITINGRILKNGQPVQNQTMCLCHEFTNKKTEIDEDTTDIGGNFSFTFTHDPNFKQVSIGTSSDPNKDYPSDIFIEYQYNINKIESALKTLPDFETYYPALFMPANGADNYYASTISDQNPIEFTWTNGGRNDITRYSLEIWDPVSQMSIYWSNNIEATSATITFKFNGMLNTNNTNEKIKPGTYKWKWWCYFGSSSNGNNDGWQANSGYKTIIIK